MNLPAGYRVQPLASRDAAMLDARPGAPSEYQLRQATQQVESRAEAYSDSAAAQAAAGLGDAIRAQDVRNDTAEAAANRLAFEYKTAVLKTTGGAPALSQLAARYGQAVEGGPEALAAAAGF